MSGNEWDELLKLKTKPPEEPKPKEEPPRIETRRIKEKPLPEIQEIKPELRGKARSIQTLQQKKRAKVQLNEIFKTLNITDLTNHQQRALSILQTPKPDWRNRKKDTIYYQKEVTIAGLELILSLLMGNVVRIDY